MHGFLLLLATYTVVLVSFAMRAPKAESYQFIQHNIGQESAIVCRQEAKKSMNLISALCFLTHVAEITKTTVHIGC